MGIAAEISSAQKIMDVIEAEGPRNHDGELRRPYSDWCKALRAVIDKGNAWLKASDLEGEGAKCRH